MAEVDLVDETFIVADPATLAAVVADRTRWEQWWPDLTLTTFMDRGVLGRRWSMTGALIGSCEIWLEPVLDGTTVHHYLRGAPADPIPDTPAGWRRAASLRRRRALNWKKHVWALKDELEGHRPAGVGARSGSDSQTDGEPAAPVSEQ